MLSRSTVIRFLVVPGFLLVTPVSAQSRTPPAMDSAQAANERAMIAMRTSASPPAPLTAYAGRYDHPLFGPVVIRLAGSGLTLQMGDGRLADLEYHGANTFYTAWRDPFFRENYGTHVSFAMAGDSVVAFTTVMNRDQFTARKTGHLSRAPSALRPDLTGVEAILGRWNLRMLGVTGPSDVNSSWLEIERRGYASLVGQFVGLIGAARPIGRIDWDKGVARFSLPTEWEVISPAWDVLSRDLRFEMRPVGDSLVGALVTPAGTMRAFVGTRAPSLRRDMPASWTAPEPLFNGKDLSGWTPAPTARSLPSFWAVRDGILVNNGDEGANLMTARRFQDFKLHAEFRLPKGGSSGVFPRGRYWVILADRADSVPYRGITGAVHGFLVPNENAYLGPDKWQTMDIALVGRRITVVVNGKTVIADQIIPGITGSAIDGDEAAPGPVMLQGEETRVEFRNITISVPSQSASGAGVVARLSSCSANDSAAAADVRARLAQWVRQANANDAEAMREVWAPGLVRWFPRASIFNDSAAYEAAGLKLSATLPPTRITYDLLVDDVAASGSMVVVHDVWTETRELAPTKRVTRRIRGSELWRCQPDGRWRIARYVSAPEPWVVAVSSNFR